MMKRLLLAFLLSVSLCYAGGLPANNSGSGVPQSYVDSADTVLTNNQAAHAASTTTAVHGLGTMAGKTATDYYTTGELATVSADLTGSNIIAPNTFLTNLGAWYTGNPTTAANTASTTLAVNGAATSLTIASGACGFIVADVTGQYDPTLSAAHVHLEAAYENHNNTLTIYGNPASSTSQINAATWSAWIDVGDGVAKIVATGAVNAIWNVEKLEVK